jgi:glycosyltransferase involved in cell wall biosynthesis
MFCDTVRLIAVRRVAGPIRHNFFSRFKYTTSMLDRIVCVSNAIKEALIRDGIPADRLVTIHSGTDLRKLSPRTDGTPLRKKLGLPENHIIIGTIAAFTPEKDYPSLIMAASKVIETCPDVTFCAVGDGLQQEHMMLLAEKFGLGGRFIFTGFRNDVEQFLSCFDIFALTSIQEGLGTSILDAQAHGLPVVACRTGGIPEIVNDGVNGFLVPVHGPTELADALIKLVRTPSMRKEFGERSIESVKLFSIDRTVKQNIALYKQIIHDRPFTEMNCSLNHHGNRPSALM